MTHADTSSPSRWGVRLVVAAVLLAGLHLGPRALILSNSAFDHRPTLDQPIKYLPKLILAGVYDAGYVALLACVFLLGLCLPKRSNRRGVIVYSLFLAAGVLSLVAALLNTVVVQQLGRPFNYQWLYYSDFLQGADARQAMAQSLTWKLIGSVLCGCAVYVLLALKLGVLGDHFFSRLSRPRRIALAVACGFALLAYFFLARWYVSDRGWHHDKLANPVYAFAQSIIRINRVPSLFTMKTTVDDSDFRPSSELRSTLATTRPPIRHIVLFVFESTPAEYVGAYGSQYGITPNLDCWSKHAAIFDNVYAHAPATNKSLFSILCGAYPWISFKAETQEMPGIALPSIPLVLAAHGFATAFFYSGDLSFQGAGEFVHHRRFDFVQDYKTRQTTRKVFTNAQWPFLNGSDDVSTVESLLEWFDQQRHAGKPTFIMLWTMMTHYPYFTEGKPDDLGPTENLFNIYLNALRTGDRAFGVLMDHLERENLLDETLVIVTGDHGEAFGRHYQLAHANRIYEENCHVPLLLINRKLFAGEHHAAVAGLCDIAPTIADILSVPPPQEWQGRSLFAVDRSDRTYFFAPWSDFLFGYRTGAMKFIYNASDDHAELYDVVRDPTEQHNLIEFHRDEIDAHMNRLAAWVQYQDRMFRSVKK